MMQNISVYPSLKRPLESDTGRPRKKRKKMNLNQVVEAVYDNLLGETSKPTNSPFHKSEKKSHLPKNQKAPVLGQMKKYKGKSEYRVVLNRDAVLDYQIKMRSAKVAKKLAVVSAPSTSSHHSRMPVKKNVVMGEYDYPPSKSSQNDSETRIREGEKQPRNFERMQEDDGQSKREKNAKITVSPSADNPDEGNFIEPFIIMFPDDEEYTGDITAPSALNSYKDIFSSEQPPPSPILNISGEGGLTIDQDERSSSDKLPSITVSNREEQTSTRSNRSIPDLLIDLEDGESDTKSEVGSNLVIDHVWSMSERPEMLKKDGNILNNSRKDRLWMKPKQRLKIMDHNSQDDDNLLRQNAQGECSSIGKSKISRMNSSGGHDATKNSKFIDAVNSNGSLFSARHTKKKKWTITKRRGNKLRIKFQPRQGTAKSNQTPTDTTKQMADISGEFETDDSGDEIEIGDVWSKANDQICEDLHGSCPAREQEDVSLQHTQVVHPLSMEDTPRETPEERLKLIDHNGQDDNNLLHRNADGECSSIRKSKKISHGNVTQINLLGRHEAKTNSKSTNDVNSQGSLFSAGPIKKNRQTIKKRAGHKLRIKFQPRRGTAISNQTSMDTTKQMADIVSVNDSGGFETDDSGDEIDIGDVWSKADDQVCEDPQESCTAQEQSVSVHHAHVALPQSVVLNDTHQNRKTMDDAHSPTRKEMPDKNDDQCNTSFVVLSDVLPNLTPSQKRQLRKSKRVADELQRKKRVKTKNLFQEGDKKDGKLDSMKSESEKIKPGADGAQNVTKNIDTFKHVCLKKLTNYYEIVIAIESISMSNKSVELRKEYNFFSTGALKDLIRALSLCKKNEQCKAVLLSSVGPIFSSGLDPISLLNWTSVLGQSSDIIHLMQRLVKILINFEKPIIAAVQGPAVGFGASLLLFCDSVYASERAHIQWPSTRMGLSACGCASAILPKVVGHCKARSLLIEGNMLTATQAKNCGLITEVFPHDTLMRHAISACNQICLSTHMALQNMKQLLVSQEKNLLQKRSIYEITMLTECLKSTECQELLQEYILTQLHMQ